MQHVRQHKVGDSLYSLYFTVGWLVNIQVLLTYSKICQQHLMEGLTNTHVSLCTLTHVSVTEPRSYKWCEIIISRLAVRRPFSSVHVSMFMGKMLNFGKTGCEDVERPSNYYGIVGKSPVRVDPLRSDSTHTIKV